VDQSDLALLVSLEFPVGLVLRLHLLPLVSLVGLDLLGFLEDRLDLGFLAGLEFLAALDPPLLQLYLGSLVDLEHLADRLGLCLLVLLVFLVDPAAPLLRLHQLLQLLRSHPSPLLLPYLLLLPLHLSLLSDQVVHRMDLSLPSDLLGQSVRLGLLMDPLHLMDPLLQLPL
jgi:hypothetical protein